MNATPIRRSLSRKETALVALGVVAWVAIVLGGSWLVHQVFRPPGDCGTPLDGKPIPAKAAPGAARNGLQLLAGTGRCR